jgi:prepilin-type N-terminal cleavage/methylation domain-containing protein
MLSNIRQSKKGKGFTIIEVLIVLAIAGLILLVVFLAVPALQRNARNTQRSTDAGNILSAVTEFVSNNNGNLPADGGTSGTGNALTIGGTGSNTIPVNLGYYTAANISIASLAAGTTNGTNTTTTDTIVVMKRAACSTTNIGTPVSASTRSLVILYTLETDAKQCRAA